MNKILAAALVAALLLAGWQWSEAVEARGKLQEEQSARSQEGQQRAGVALVDKTKVAAAQAQHATDQQGITHDLHQDKAARESVDAGRRTVVVRLLNTSADLAAAGDRLKAATDASTCRDLADQHRALIELLQEGGRLVARSGAVAGEGAQLLGGREAEVKALKGVILADRALMSRSAAQDPR